MIVIKYGGHALPENGRVDKSLEVVAIEFKKGKQFVLVHGGGPQINKELELHNIKPEMINGRRKTTPEVLSVVSKVLSGEILRGIVNQFISLGVNAVGISSGDGGTIRAIYSEDALGEVGVVDKALGETELLPSTMAWAAELAKKDRQTYTLIKRRWRNAFDKFI